MKLANNLSVFVIYVFAEQIVALLFQNTVLCCQITEYTTEVIPPCKHQVLQVEKYYYFWLTLLISFFSIHKAEKKSTSKPSPECSKGGPVGDYMMEGNFPTIVHQRKNEIQIKTAIVSKIFFSISLSLLSNKTNKIFDVRLLLK